LKKQYQNLVEYVKGLIALRKAYPQFCFGKADLVREHLSFLENEEPSALGFRLTAPDSTQEIYVLINGEREAVSFSVPQGEYTILANGEKVCPKGLSTLNIGSENSLSLQPIEALILLRK
ncbi:MAG: type I pullulanase, partial [Alistipes sp.]|nr:type I pullulanase [Alistipes sp.]